MMLENNIAMFDLSQPEIAKRIQFQTAESNLRRVKGMVSDEWNAIEEVLQYKWTFV